MRGGRWFVCLFFGIVGIGFRLKVMVDFLLDVEVFVFFVDCVVEFVWWWVIEVVVVDFDLVVVCLVGVL